MISAIHELLASIIDIIERVLFNGTIIKKIIANRIAKTKNIITKLFFTINHEPKRAVLVVILTELIAIFKRVDLIIQDLI